MAEEIAELKRRPGKDIAVFGSADLAATLLRLGLIDEVRIFLNPVVLGTGNQTFKHVTDRVTLRLFKTETFRSGVVVLYYRP